MGNAVLKPSPGLRPGPESVEQKLTPQAMLELLQPHGDVRTFDKQTVLQEQGQPSQAIHMIISGVVTRMNTSPLLRDNGDFLIDFHGEGETVGLPEVLAMSPYINSMTGHIPGKVLQINADKFKSFLSSHPDIREYFGRQIVAQIRRDTTKLVITTSITTIEDKLRLMLIDLAERFGKPGPSDEIILDLELSMLNWGSFVGTSVETACRALGALHRKRLIEKADFTPGERAKPITIPNLNHLRL